MSADSSSNAMPTPTPPTDANSKAQALVLSSVTCALSSLIAFVLGAEWTSGILAICAWCAAALRLELSRNWKPFAFSLWVMAFVTAAFAFPWLFDKWGSTPASKYIGPLIQVIMFGMGATLSAADFARVLVRPKAVFIGMLLQFTVMPFAGYCLTKVFSFPPEIAAGVVLIGACPGGVASNVITYLARGDVALSVTMTACSTLMAPIMTPLMMRWLGGSYIEVSFYDMMWSILMTVIIPTVGGLIVNTILEKMKLRGPWVDSWLSALAIVSICIVIGIIVAGAKASLMQVGPLVILCAMLHNSIGYLLGYFGAKVCGMNEAEARTISIEVGMQNGGMGASLATNVLKSEQAALAPAIFGAWMSIAGSVLASFWRRSAAASASTPDKATDVVAEKTT